MKECTKVRCVETLFHLETKNLEKFLNRGYVKFSEVENILKPVCLAGLLYDARQMMEVEEVWIIKGTSDTFNCTCVTSEEFKSCFERIEGDKIKKDVK